MSSILFPLLAFAAASGAWQLPTSAKLAKAIEAFTGKPVAVAEVRRVSCVAIEEEPTEAVCKWQQRIGKRWQRYSTYAATDGRGWHLIDEPGPSR
jgi:hypothetical protein